MLIPDISSFTTPSHDCQQCMLSNGKFPCPTEANEIHMWLMLCLPFDILNELLLGGSDDSLEDFAEDMDGALLSHRIDVELFEEGPVSPCFVFDGHFQFPDRLETALEPLALLLIRRVQIQALSPDVGWKIPEAIDAEQGLIGRREHDAELVMDGALSHGTQ